MLARAMAQAAPLRSPPAYFHQLEPHPTCRWCGRREKNHVVACSFLDSVRTKPVVDVAKVTTSTPDQFQALVIWRLRSEAARRANVRALGAPTFSDAFRASIAHPSSCRCDACLYWRALRKDRDTA